VFTWLAAVIYFLWYPGFLFQYDGGLEGVQLIAGVDLLIGPFLTLCVYKLGKSSLRFDLTVIALLQIGCLTGGMWTVWQTRPVAVVYAAGGFRTISYRTFVDYGVLPESVALLRQRWPVWIAVAPPESEVPEHSDLVARLIFERSAYFKTGYYVPYSTYQEAITKEAISIPGILSTSPELTQTFEQYPVDSLVYRLACGAGSGYVILNHDHDIVGTFIDLSRQSPYKIYLDKVKQMSMKIQHSLG
jgi:hypothetical protein